MKLIYQTFQYQRKYRPVINSGCRWKLKAQLKQMPCSSFIQAEGLANKKMLYYRRAVIHLFSRIQGKKKALQNIKQ